MTWTATVLTILPEMFPGPVGHSLAGKALERGVWRLDVVDIRDSAADRHRTVDDAPFGGGPGLVMRPYVVDAALGSVDGAGPAFYLSPRGTPLTQAIAHDLAAGPGVLLLAGRFEGVDQRVIEGRKMWELSIGDYVLSGGELAAMVLIDACVRLLPGVLGAAASIEHESFETGMLEHPQYTKPREWEGRTIPDVLVSGDHKKVAVWREQQAQELTQARRPDLLAAKHRNER